MKYAVNMIHIVTSILVCIHKLYFCICFSVLVLVVGSYELGECQVVPYFLSYLNTFLLHLDPRD